MKTLFWVLLLVNPLTFIADTNQRQEQARRYFQNQDFRQAISEYTYIINELEMPSPEVYLNLAHAYFEQRNAEKASLYYKQALASPDANVQSVALNQLGYIQAVEQNLPEALALFKQALDKNPGHEEARFNYELIKKRLTAQATLSPTALGSGGNTQQQQRGTRLTPDARGRERVAQSSTAEDAPRQPDKLSKLKINQEKAEAILNALKNQEQQYLRQKPSLRPPIGNTASNRPVW